MGEFLLTRFLFGSVIFLLIIYISSQTIPPNMRQTRSIFFVYSVNHRYNIFAYTGEEQEDLQQSTAVSVERARTKDSRTRHCSNCKKPGHTRRRCPET